MSSMCNRLNAAPSYKTIGELKTNVRYLIRFIEKVDTDYGKAISAVITDQESTYKIIFPKRYTHVFTEEDIIAYKDCKFDFYTSSLNHEFNNDWLLLFVLYVISFLFIFFLFC